MRNTRSQPGDERTPLRAARSTLAALAVLLAAQYALSAGCGGSKSEQSSSSPASSPAPTTSAPAAQSPAGAPAESAASAPTAADLGAQVFAKRCALCHGVDGHGDGVGSKGLKPQPRNFHDRAYMSTRPDSALLRVIHQGKGPMPRWGGVLSKAEISAVLGHVRALGKKP